MDVKTQSNSPDSSIPVSTSEQETPQTIELNPKIFSTYLEYLLTGELSDITIYAPLEDDPEVKVTFKLHRFIIASRSQPLASQLHHTPILHIPCPAHIFQALVWSMYTDTNDNMPNHLLPQIFWAAHYYQVRPAETWCLQQIIKCTKVDNCIAIANDLIEHYSILDFTKSGIECPYFSLDDAPAVLRYVAEVISFFVQRKVLRYDQLTHLNLNILTLVDEFLARVAHGG